jgi:hypothetical protein
MADAHKKADTHKGKEVANVYPPPDVCCGGTVSVGSAYVPFVNSTGAPQTLSNCQLWRGSAAVPPTPQGGNPTPVPITINPPPAAGSSYSFQSTCNCPGGTPPAIKFQ